MEEGNLHVTHDAQDSAERTARPRTGDALGQVFLECLSNPSIMEVFERDDGYVRVHPAAAYISPLHEWPAHEQRAIELLRGRVLDVGCGAGRAATTLQERGFEISGLDTSPGAIEASRRRGVASLFLADVETHTRSQRSYDSVLLFGGNVGLLGSAQYAPTFLRAVELLTVSGSSIVALGTDPYGTDDPANRRYMDWNRRRGRMAGQVRARIRFRDLATSWFDYLFCSIEELETLLYGSAWRLAEVDVADHPHYVVVLRR